MISEYLYIPLITWLIAQVIKFSIATLQGKYRPSLLFSSGGMPSVHSATVASLATVALIEGGANSPLFGITGVFAAIVMYDSLGVRRAAGEQAKVLNLLIEDLSSSGAVKTPKKYGHLREILGHRPLEVAIGVVLGVATTSILLGSRLLEQASWLLTAPANLARWAQIGLAVLLILIGVAAYLTARSRSSRKLARYRPFLKQFLIANLVIAAIFLGLVFLQTQAVSMYNTWLFVVLGLLLLFFWHAALWYMLLVDGKLRASIADVSVQARKQKWMKPKRKSSRTARRASKRK
jgi:acid phosphatase family membrane protein YuiD